jgi:tetratricopeptide (TPR) repeat protein
VTAEHRGQGPNVVRWANRGLKLVEHARTDEELIARSELRLVRAERFQRMGRNLDALPWCELAAADAKAADNAHALARAYTVLDLAALALGRLDEITHLPRALEIWEEFDSQRNQGTVLTILGATRYYLGQWDDALRFFERGRDAYLRAGDVVNAAHGTNNMADILIDQGRAAEAEAGLLEVLDLWRSVQFPAGIAGVLLNLGRCALQRDDFAEALSLFEEAKATSGAANEAASVVADAWLSETLIHTGEPATALPIIDAALQREAATGSTMFMPKLLRVRGFALAAMGDREAALAALETSLESARARESLYDIALTLDAMATLRSLTGLGPDPAADAERDELLERLGVRDISAPEVAA